MPGHRHDDGDARLVVGPEQRRAAGRDDVVAHLCGQVGKLLRRQHGSGIVGQDDVAAGIAAMHDGLDAGRVERRGRVHVREKRDRGRLRLDRGWDASPAPRRSRSTERPERRCDFSSSTSGLSRSNCFCGAGRCRRALVGLRVDARVADEAVLELAIELGFHASFAGWWCRNCLGSHRCCSSLS